MSRTLAIVFAFIASFCTAQAAERPLAVAMDALRDGNWAAARIAARGDGQIAQDVIMWHYLRSANGTSAQVEDFLARNGDWPGLPYLRKKSEEAMAKASHAAVRAYFQNNAPQTGTGALSLARALIAAGEDGAARAEIVLAWRTLSLSSDERAAFLKDYGALLKPHHTARLDMSIWNGWTQNARALMPLVDEGQQKLAEAKLGLRASAGGVDALIEAVPASLQNDPGLAYQRFAWRMRKGRTADALDLMLERSISAEALGEPNAWAGRRRTIARDLMRKGQSAQAYRVASAHFLTEGSAYADLEWLSGYLALRHLNAADVAILHFERFAEAVESPISLGRAGYWLGRAYAAEGDTEEAKLAFGVGAQFQTSFYGLLAAEALGAEPDPTLAGTETFPPWRGAAFTQASVFKAAMLLLAADELNLAERFFTHLTESLTRTEVGQLGDLLEELDQPHIQVMVGKRAAQFGMQVPGPYYALHPVADAEHRIPTEMILSIARRESEFDHVVVSGAGARGLMQVMPGTAKEVAGSLGIEFTQAKLTTDWPYNATLGSAYLATLSKRFQGNAVMMSAAYNAGPSRPIRWMDQFGDPRGDAMDVVDWIEMIPFRETRNYVMRVTESLPVYRARLGKPALPVPFSQELVSSTLLARAPEGE